MSSKKLHHHSVPLLILGVGLFVGTIGAVQYMYASSGHSSNQLSRAFSSHLLSVKKTESGVVHIDISTQTSAPNVPVTPEPTDPMSQALKAGQTTRTSIANPPAALRR